MRAFSSGIDANYTKDNGQCERWAGDPNNNHHQNSRIVSKWNDTGDCFAAWHIASCKMQNKVLNWKKNPTNNDKTYALRGILITVLVIFDRQNGQLITLKKGNTIIELQETTVNHNANNNYKNNNNSNNDNDNYDYNYMNNNDDNLSSSKVRNSILIDHWSYNYLSHYYIFIIIIMCLHYIESLLVFLNLISHGFWNRSTLQLDLCECLKWNTAQYCVTVYC